MYSPRWLGIAALVLSAATSVSAQTLDSRSTWYVQAGLGEEGSRALVLGATLPWQGLQWQLGSGKVQAHWDLWLGGWSNKDLQDQRFSTPALGIGPSLRWRGAGGTSPWFVEAGTGVMVTGKHLFNAKQRMGTRWNFASHIGVGMNFGHQQAHAISLRLQHASNAGIQNPNPGINFVQLRYARDF